MNFQGEELNPILIKCILQILGDIIKNFTMIEIEGVDEHFIINYDDIFIANLKLLNQKSEQNAAQ